MKIIIFSLLLFFINIPSSKADFWTGLIVGVLLTEDDSSPTETPTKSNLELELEEIHKMIPRNVNFHSHIKEKTIYVSEENKSQILAYFKNKGFNIELKDNYLLFDLSEQHKKYIDAKNEPLPLWIKVILGFCIISLATTSILSIIKSFFPKKFDKIKEDALLDLIKKINKQ